MEDKELEKVLSNLAGIRAVKLVSNGNGSLTEVHVLATADKPPKQVARDVETAIFAYTGKRIDRKIISVAQVGENGTQENEKIALTERGLRLVKISRSIGEDPVLEVTLENDEGEYIGRSRVPIDNEKGVARAAVLATVEALREIEEVSGELEFFDVFSYPSYKIAIAVFNTTAGKRVQADFLEGDPSEAGVKLALKALMG